MVKDLREKLEPKTKSLFINWASKMGSNRAFTTIVDLEELEKAPIKNAF